MCVSVIIENGLRKCGVEWRCLLQSPCPFQVMKIEEIRRYESVADPDTSWTRGKELYISRLS